MNRDRTLLGALNERDRGMSMQARRRRAGRIALGTGLTLAAATAVVVGGAITNAHNREANSPEHVSSADFKANKELQDNKSPDRLRQVAVAGLAFNDGVSAYSQPDNAAKVRFTTGEGKLAGKTLRLKAVGVVPGSENQDQIWEVFEAPSSLVDAKDPASSPDGQAERYVYVNASALADLPEGNVYDVHYTQASDGTVGGFKPDTNSVVNAGLPQNPSLDLQAKIVPLG